MLKSINDIVNSKRNYHWNIDNDHRKSATKSDKYQQIDIEAYAVERKMGNTGDQIAHKLYCKAFYHLAPVTIWNSVELALNKGRNPAKYLSWLLTKELNNKLTNS